MNEDENQYRAHLADQTVWPYFPLVKCLPVWFARVYGRNGELELRPTRYNTVWHLPTTAKHGTTTCQVGPNNRLSPISMRWGVTAERFKFILKVFRFETMTLSFGHISHFDNTTNIFSVILPRLIKLKRKFQFHLSMSNNSLILCSRKLKSFKFLCWECKPNVQSPQRSATYEDLLYLYWSMEWKGC